MTILLNKSHFKAEKVFIFMSNTTNTEDIMNSIAKKKQIENELNELSIKYLNKFAESDEIVTLSVLQDKESFILALKSPLELADMLITAAQCSMEIDGFVEKFAKLIESELDKHEPDSCCR